MLYTSVQDKNLESIQICSSFGAIHKYLSLGVCRECDLYLMFCYAFMPPELRPYHLKDVNFTESDRNASQLFSNIMRRYVANQ